MAENNPKHTKNVSYSRCGACGRIFAESDWGHFRGATAPCCGAKGAGREPWPPTAVTKLLETTSEQDIETPNGAQTAATLLCCAANLVIENILVNHIKTSSNMPEALNINAGSLENLLQAYERTSGSPMAERFDSLGAAGFMEDILELNRLRGKLVCNRDYPMQPAERRALLSARDWCVKYFVLLNNNLISKGAKKAAEPAPARPAKKIRSVLVVDDELNVLDFMCRLVKRQGLEVFGAATGTEGIRLFRENGPDCVFLDIALPDMDGLSVLKEIKGLNPSAVVHMVTGIGGEAIEKEARKLDADGYISKPVDAATLIDLIKSA